MGARSVLISTTALHSGAPSLRHRRKAESISSMRWSYGVLCEVPTQALSPIGLGGTPPTCAGWGCFSTILLHALPTCPYVQVHKTEMAATAPLFAHQRRCRLSGSIGGRRYYIQKRGERYTAHSSSGRR